MVPVPPQRTQETEDLWPERTRSVRCDLLSQIRTVLSFELEARRCSVELWRK